MMNKVDAVLKFCRCMLMMTFGIAVLAGAVEAEERLNPAPQLRLRAYWQTALLHDKHEPLLLSLLLSNDAATDTQLRNHSAKLENSNTTIESVPSLKIGSLTEPLSKLVSFEIQSSDGKLIQIPVRPLKLSSLESGLVTLDDQNSVDLFFGIDSSELNKLPEGSYKISASLSSKSNSGTWEGHQKSNFVTVDLKGKQPGINTKQKLYHYGRYYLLDGDYARTDACAEKLRALDADSISACELHGDAAMGRKDKKEAYKAFQRGIELYEAKWAAHSGNLQQVVEPPSYLQQRLEDASD